MRGMLLLVAIAIATAGTASAQVIARASWGRGDPCRRFAGTRGFCTPEGRWKSVSGNIAIYYLPDGRSFAMHIAEAEANGALDSETGPPDPDAPLDDELDRAHLPR